jgi:Tol biopolymer transport system component
MDPDGSHKRQLTADDEDAGWPVWSPNGKKILYWACREGNHDVWVMDADGSNRKRLTDHPALDGEGEWSPDGKQIVFVSERTGNGDLYLMDADGSHQKQLTFNEKALDWTPHWSPDGKKIAYLCDDTPKAILELWVMDLETGEKKPLTPETQDNVVPQWRPPDGKELLYQGWTGGTYAELKGSYDLMIMNPDGSEKKTLIPSPVNEMSNRWSPDGKRILFWSWRTGNPELFLVNPDGSGLAQLTDNLAWDMFPAWSPDGKRIAFDSDRMGNFDIWVMEVPK